jgi:hypothetical protein
VTSLTKKRKREQASFSKPKYWEFLLYFMNVLSIGICHSFLFDVDILIFLFPPPRVSFCLKKCSGVT